MTATDLEALRERYRNYRWRRHRDGGVRFTDKETCDFYATTCQRRAGHGGKCDEPLVLDDADGKCVTGGLGHGPGHQSTARCDVLGEHKTHHCIYSGQEAWWRGAGLTFSGFFDEPPDEDDA